MFFCMQGMRIWCWDVLWCWQVRSGVPFGFATLAGDEEKVDDLSDEKEPACEEPDDAGDPSA